MGFLGWSDKSVRVSVQPVSREGLARYGTPVGLPAFLASLEGVNRTPGRGIEWAVG
jgi:hypothetical protein